MVKVMIREGGGGGGRRDDDDTLMSYDKPRVFKVLFHINLIYFILTYKEKIN